MPAGGLTRISARRHDDAARPDARTRPLLTLRYARSSRRCTGADSFAAGASRRRALEQGSQGGARHFYHDTYPPVTAAAVAAAVAMTTTAISRSSTRLFTWERHLAGTYPHVRTPRGSPSCLGNSHKSLSPGIHQKSTNNDPTPNPTVRPHTRPARNRLSAHSADLRRRGLVPSMREAPPRRTDAENREKRRTRATILLRISDSI